VYRRSFLVCRRSFLQGGPRRLDRLRRLLNSDRRGRRLRYHSRRRLEPVEGHTPLAATLVDPRQRTNRRQIVWRDAEHGGKLALRLIEQLQLHQRTPKGHTRRQIRRMVREASTAHPNRFLKLADSAVLLGQLRKRN